MLRSLILLAAVFVALIVPSAASAAWLEPETVATATSPRDLAVTMTAAGETLVSYTTDGRVRVVRRSGGTYETLLDEVGSQPTLDVDAAGTAYVLWRAGATGLKLATRPANGTFTIADAAEPDSYRPLLDVSGDGSAIVGWESGGVFKAAVREGHGPFVAETVVTGANWPKVAVGDGGRAIATWQDTQSRGRYRLRPAGGGFGATQVVETPDQDTAYLTPAANDRGDVLVTWWNDGVREAHAGGGDLSLTAPGSVSTLAPDVTSVGYNPPLPALGPDGSAVVLFNYHPSSPAEPDGTSYIKMARRTTGDFGEPIDVAPPSPGRDLGYSAQSAAIGPDGRALVLVGRHYEDGTALDAGTARPGRDVVLHELHGVTENTGALAIAGDAVGATSAVWITDDERIMLAARTPDPVVGEDKGAGAVATDVPAAPRTTVGTPPASPPPAPRRDLAAPVVKGLKLAPAARGTRALTFTLTEPGAVSIAIERSARGRRVGGACVKASRSNRRRPACTRWTKAGRPLSVKAEAGVNRVAVPAGGLAPGGYRLVVIAEDAAGNRSRAVQETFGVKRRAKARRR